MLELWKGLTLFLEDLRTPLDNIAAERALRSVVVGRKIHQGSKSKLGTEVAAIFHTLFETAKLSGVDARVDVHPRGQPRPSSPIMESSPCPHF